MHCRPFRALASLCQTGLRQSHREVLGKLAERHISTLQLRFPKLIAAQHSTPSCTETLRRQEISGFMQRKAAAADDAAFDRRA